MLKSLKASDFHCSALHAADAIKPQRPLQPTDFNSTRELILSSGNALHVHLLAVCLGA